MGAELFGRSGLRKWYNERKKKRKKVSSNGWYRLGEWMFVEHSAPGIERCCKSSKCYCYCILTQQGRGISKAFFSQLAGPYLKELLLGGDCSQALVMTEQPRHSLCLQSCPGHPPGPAKAPAPPWCFWCAHTLFPEKSLGWKHRALTPGWWRHSGKAFTGNCCTGK